MKKINILALCGMICFLCSCGNMLDGIQGFLDQGETIYVGKLDSLKTFPGKNRVKIQGQMLYGVNQVKCVISYKDPVTLEGESQEFPVERKEAGETFEFMLDNLTEGQYDFSVVTYDPQNNKSIPMEVSAYVYGEQYQQALTNRIIKSISPEEILNDKGQGEWVANIEWSISKGDGIVGCNMEYEQEDGSMKTVYVPVDETSTRLSGFKAGGKLIYNTEYLPDEDAIDKFTAGNRELALPEKSYVGVNKDLTNLYIKNAGYPITGHDVNNNWGIPDYWQYNEVMTTSNGAGGAGFATYQGGIIQFESTRWDKGTYNNGKVWQTITLPQGTYVFSVEVNNAANIGAEPDKRTYRFAVVKGNELPDNETLTTDPNTLSYCQFERAGETVSLPEFTLLEPTTLTVGWVVSINQICRNIEFKSVKLRCVAE